MKFARSRPSIDTLCTSPLPVHASAFLRQSANQAVCHVSPSSFLTTSMLYSLYGVVSLLHPTTNHGVHSVLCVESPDYAGRVLTRLKMQGSHPPKNSPKQQHLRLRNFTLLPFTLIPPVWPFSKERFRFWYVLPPKWLHTTDSDDSEKSFVSAKNDAAHCKTTHRPTKPSFHNA